MSCGSLTPRLPQNSRDHTPPASTTASQATRPRSVTAAAMRPPWVSIPRTAQPVTMAAPCLRAAAAIAGAAHCGSARPSLGVYRPPTQPPAKPGNRAAASAAVTSRVSRWNGRTAASHASRSANSAWVRDKYRMPLCRQPVSAPVSASISRHSRRLSIASGNSRGSRPIVRHQPQLRLDCSAAMPPFPQSRTGTPLRARNKAVVAPIMPPPTTTTPVRAGKDSSERTGSTRGAMRMVNVTR